MSKWRKPPLVEVEWVDATGYESLNGPLGEILEVARLAIRETNGLLLFQDAQRTILAHDYDKPLPDEHEHRFGNITVIPTGWVRKIRHIERKPKEGANGAEASAGTTAKPGNGGAAGEAGAAAV